LEPAGGSLVNRASNYVNYGRARHLQGRFQEAVTAYDTALRLRPDLGPAHYLRGKALLELNQPQEAERAFGECLRHQPGFGGAYRGRGQARVRQGDFSGAVADYTQAVEQQRDASILTHRGWAYFFSDAWKLAEHDFDEAIKLDAQPGDAYVGRGLARVMLGDYRRAVADADEALRDHRPDMPEMMHNVACVFALAAARVRADAGEPQRAALETGYQRQALTALRQALLLVPAGQRLAYWQEKMRPDPALDSIRNLAEFVQLDSELQKEFGAAGAGRTP